MKRLLAAGCMLLALTALCAQEMEEGKARLPQFFADGMVLQHSVPVPVWGWGRAGDRIVVEVAGRRAKTVVQADGTWRVMLPRLKAGGPYRMEVSESRAGVKPVVTFVTRIENVLVGDVFLCSGQSNMELPVRRCMDKVRPLVEGYSNDQIRYLKLPQQYNYVRPDDDVRILPWQDITPRNCGEVSAICYFMARELQERTGVPVGIVNSSVGGTKVQAWMPREVLATFAGYPEELAGRKYHQEDWVDSIRRIEAQAMRDWEGRMMATDTVIGRWRAEGYDFGAWEEVDMFRNWSRDKNGSYWFETTLVLPREAAGRSGLLRFGAMKDADSIFVNGVCVGNTTYQYPPRVYAVKEGILREGENHVVVHLMSQNGRAGFTEGKLYQLEVGDEVYPFGPRLRMAVGCTMPQAPGSTYFVDTPTGLYNAMVHPLQDYPIKGMLWYQGESNQDQRGDYADMLKAMVEAWRTQWKNDFAAVIVQLPSYMNTHEQPVETGWTRIRQQQSLAVQRIAKAALVPTFDTGEFNDIHPQDKNVSGKRAAQQMMRLVYGTRTAESDVPTPVVARVENGAAVITFRQVGTGLTVHGSAPEKVAILVGGKYRWATASVVAPDRLLVQLPQGVTATTVRYGWDDFLQPTLFTREGMPVPQFEIQTR